MQVWKHALLAAVVLLAGLDAPARAGDETFTICVLDQDTRQPLAGVRLRDGDAQLLAMTDQTGTAEIPVSCADEAVLTLSRNGYPIKLVEGTQLSSHSLVVMRRFTRGVPPVRFTLL